MPIRPVALPISSQEVTFIQRRQAELARQMNLVDQKRRNGTYSNAEANNRKMFLKSEIDQLEYLKTTRRPPGGVKFTPPPMIPRGSGQASKYQSTTSQTTTQSGGSTRVDSGTKPNSTNTGKVNTGKKVVTIKDIPSRFAKNYQSILSDNEKKESGGYFFSYDIKHKGKTIKAYYGPRGRSYNQSSTENIKDFRNWCKMHLGKEYTHYLPYRSTQQKSRSSSTQKSKEPQLKNPYGKAYGNVFGEEDRIRTDGWYVIDNGQFYGPYGTVSKNTGYLKRYGVRMINVAKSDQIARWKKWNTDRGIRYGKATKTIRVSDLTKSSSSTRSSSSSSSSSSTRSSSSSSRKEPIYKNPHGMNYGTIFSDTEKFLTSGNYVMYGKYYYGPKHTPKDFPKVPFAIPNPTEITQWKAWNKANGIVSKTLTVPKSSSTSTKPSQKDNPYAKNYGSIFGENDRDDSDGYFVLENGNFYGPKKGTTKFISNVIHWKKWNDDRKIAYGRSRNSTLYASRYKSAAEAINDAKAKAEKYAKELANKFKSATSSFSILGSIEGPPVELIHKDAVKRRREATLIRARRGARLDINRAGRRRKAPSWTSIATTQEKQMIQQGLTMVGLTEMPKLTERGNEVLVQAIRTNRIENPQKKMEVGTRRMGRVLTELINNSGYFAVKYKAKVSPTFPPQVQLSEMAGIAGGFSKTRNSMQRLLRR